MIIHLTISSAGNESGPYDLYSNIDGFTTPFETGITKASLMYGYTSVLVPDYTSIVRVKSVGICDNYLDVVLESTTTTSTTTTSTSTTTTTTTSAPIIACAETTSSGGPGITEYTVALDNPSGGYIVFEFNSFGVPDKLEIIHNGLKRSTTGMSVANSGPFDDLYGDPTVPTIPQTMVTNQFIGSDKGSIPTRQTTFATETGSSLTIEAGYHQLVWFVYSAADYTASSTCLIRITGPAGTAWELKRLCEPTTTTTTTTIAPSTTTTTTTTVIITTLIINDTGSSSSTLACSNNVYPINIYTGDETVTTGTITYSDYGLTTPFNGNGLWFHESISNYAYQIDTDGSILSAVSCV